MDHQLPACARSSKAKKVYSRPVLNGHGGRASSRSTRSARTSAAACRLPHLAVVRVPVPRLAVQPGRREEGRPAPRGLDRFATRSSGGVLTVDTGTVIQGPPIGTNTTGQEAEGPHCVRRSGALMPVIASQAVLATAAVRHRWRHRRRPHRRLRRRGHRQHASRSGRGRLRDRARGQPQALPQRRGARGQEARPHARLRRWCCWSSSPSPCRSTGWPSPAGRPARSRRSRKKRSSRAARRSTTPRPSAPTATVRGRRRRALATPAQRQRRLRRRRSTGRRRRSTRCCSATAGDEVKFILNYGRPFSPMPAWGAPGGGPLTDQQLENLDRLPRQHPAPVERRADGARRTRSTRCASPTPATNRCTLYGTDRRGQVADARRGPVQHRPLRRLRRRRLLLRPLPHQGLVLRHARGRRRRRLSARTSPTAARLRTSRPPGSRSAFVTTGSELGKLYRPRRHRIAARCPASASTPTPSIRSRPPPPG